MTRIEELTAVERSLWEALEDAETDFIKAREAWGAARDRLLEARQDALVEARVQERLAALTTKET